MNIDKNTILEVKITRKSNYIESWYNDKLGEIYSVKPRYNNGTLSHYVLVEDLCYSRKRIINLGVCKIVNRRDKIHKIINIINGRKNS